MPNNRYYLGANDEHGVNPPTNGKRTPVMPYINRRIYENEFNTAAKNDFIESALRNDFRIYDVKPEQQDVPVSARVRRINAQGLTLLVTFAYNAFGSGNAFNSANGFETYYSVRNADASDSRALGEDIFESLKDKTNQTPRFVGQLDIGVLSSVNCPSALIEAGFMTNLSEAKLMLDWNYQTLVAEATIQGVVNDLGSGASYVERNNLAVYPLLRQRSRGNFVMLAQFLLAHFGYSLAVDGIFGSETAAVVRRFQSENKLASDGLIGNATWKTLLYLPPYPLLSFGAKGVYVKYLQSKLTAKLYPSGKIDGIFGNATLNAVKQFQEENGLAVDGIVGPNTWALLSVIGGGRS